MKLVIYPKFNRKNIVGNFYEKEHLIDKMKEFDWKSNNKLYIGNSFHYENGLIINEYIGFVDKLVINHDKNCYIAKVHLINEKYNHILNDNCLTLVKHGRITNEIVEIYKILGFLFLPYKEILTTNELRKRKVSKIL